ncbi:MAG: ABC transporter ATP-binding protein [Candidatus Altiarchaeota archaeon]|nr:ABC transporter ATP-binding protein [Candidatus Altiarchaeota archaeon]
MGHSGSGKSTMLNMAGILDVPTKGKIKLMGKDVPKSEAERAKLRSEFMGFIFQDFGLIPSITAKDNILLPTLFGGNTPENRVDEIAEQLGMTPRLNHYPSQLSGGEKQRVAIARSLINNPKIIFADEPTGNLDSKTGDMVMKLLRSLADGGKTVVIVSHNPEHEAYADTVINMKDGKII